MAARKKGPSKIGDEAEHPKKPVKKPTPLGTDPALTLPTSKGKSLSLTYWDLWFALVAEKDCGGDIERLAESLKERKSFISFNRRAVERKRNHLRDLENRLVDVRLTAEDIVAASGDLARTEVRRARSRVLEHSEREREWSEPMRNTPRKRWFDHALRGYWPHFPVSPKPYAEEIGSHFKTKSFYSESMSFGIARTLDRYAEKATKLLEAGKAAQTLALLRAWMTVVIELIEHADDSCGSIGDSFGEGFVAYLKIPLDKTGIDENVFFPDLLDFLIWEDYGLTDDGIKGYFTGLTPAQADLCINHLRQQIDELRADDLEYQSEEALTLLGQVVAEQERFDMFEDLAREMGSREWQRIIHLVDRAVKKRKRPLACQVFEAALTKGSHLDFLTKKYEQLKRGHWSPDPRK
jgi:hypothetical protein